MIYFTTPQLLMPQIKEKCLIMPMNITFGMFDTSSLSHRELIGYQLILNEGELYGEH